MDNSQGQQDVRALMERVGRQDQVIAQLRQENAQLRQRVADLQQGGNRGDSRSGVGEFLSGAAQIAVGIGGGMLAADVIGDVFGDDGGDSWW
ncbi:hypothetical protein ACFXHA_01445 [Nocardia sp. NPDC059240]|uniref:hypothetical protein n=1 Tax=Nocardia sp. NPDC059240 TaxID=3346786 RepID=UPI0036CDC150